MSEETPRIAPGRLRQLGPFNWVTWRIVSLVMGTDDAKLFSVLGRTGGLYRGWLFHGAHLMPGGRIPNRETEMIILRVAHLRGSDYEFDHHTRLGRLRGVTDEVRERVIVGPDAPDWSPRERAVLTAVDELVTSKDLSDATWTGLSEVYDDRRLLEFLLLVGQYDGLATTLHTLRMPRDRFDRARTLPLPKQLR
ncbi:carboxymuconolactone decarboxylase family protein [Millisia brevis]|uniref:carboxymuconolactone decarboxylase family protein n=1 Tax=Millisia brevis TaxID=264148 RepID=UPI000833AF71|nr:carboxymuconolactone decarboxylase family protein [Millisia brevis]